MTDWNAVSAFMAKVVAWPGDQTPGFVNLHYSYPDAKNGGEIKKGAGWPFKSVDDFVSRAAWVNTRQAQFRDVWFCTSLQSHSGVTKKGKPKAVRLAANAVALKSIWIDVDVGQSEPGKKPKYATVEEALRAVLLFAQTVKLPTPSAIVYSGGGIHVYWINKDPMAPAEWHQYASGLKNLLLANNVLCDAGLTTDAARILRVPGTFNYKYDPPREVTLAPLPLKVYDFPTKLAFLQQHAGPMVGPAAPSHKFQLFADDADMASFKKPPVFKIDEPDLQAGIDKFADHLLEPLPIFRHCGFLREALTTGGRDYDQTLWMYSVLCSTFMENGNEIAHKISSGHASYTQTDTQALFDRKMADRHDRGIGYPSCAAIQSAGCKACASCPLLPKGKSPLNIRPAPAVTAAVSAAVQTPQALAAALPAGFDLNNDGIICKVLEEDNDGEITTHMIPLFQAQLFDFWLQKWPGERLNFTCTVDKGFVEQTFIEIGKIGGNGWVQLLQDRRVLPAYNGKKFLEEFFMSTIGKLRAMAAAQQSIPFGWYEEDGTVKGFVFDGRVMLDDGTERPCGAIDANIAKTYRPCGTIDKWREAARTITLRNRPELTCIVLTAFASPLVKLLGRNALTAAAYGSDSGAGKSSAYAIGMSVWGHPVLTKGTESQTVNNITTIMKTIRNLPFYWDEITDDTHREKVRKVMMEADGGKEKGRDRADGGTRDVGQWSLMIQYAANGSLREYVRTNNVNTAAGLMRILEWEVRRIDTGPGMMQDADATALIASLSSNYGHMGALYARYLASNHVAIQQELLAKANDIASKLRGGGDKRLWYALMATMICAAKYARLLGVEVDEKSIEAFMYETYAKNAFDLEEAHAGGVTDNSEEVLAEYLQERDAQQRIMWTNTMHLGAGRAPSKPVTVLNSLGQERNNMGPVTVRFAWETRVCVIVKNDFIDWMKTKKYSDTFICAALRLVYVMEQQRVQLMGGWLHDAGRQRCFVLKVGPKTPLWNYMLTYTSPEDRKNLIAAPVVTGLVPEAAHA
jgi:Domain of unknown function (DUF927)